MSNYTLTLSKAITCPSVSIIDDTTYPVSPDEHSIDYVMLYKLSLYNYSDLSTTIYSNISEVSPDVLIDESPLTMGGINYSLDLDDGLYKADVIALPISVSGKTYAIDDCVVYLGVVYKCSTAGTMTDVNPSLSAGAIFATCTDVNITARYKSTVYLSSICDVLQGMTNTGLDILSADCLNCPIICENEDVRSYYSEFILIQNADMENPTDAQIQALYFRIKFYENLSFLNTLQNG